MSAIETIINRRSIRFYSEKDVSENDIRTILKAGMSGPTCTNARDWSFIVVKDKEILNRMADANGGPAAPLRRCNFAILILGDLDRAFSVAPDYWVIDGAIAGQNMSLAAEELGIGNVWLGTWPQMDRVENQRKLFDLPDNVIPHSVLAFGYPSESEDPYGSRFPENSKPEWEENRVHYDQW